MKRNQTNCSSITIYVLISLLMYNISAFQICRSNPAPLHVHVIKWFTKGEISTLRIAINFDRFVWLKSQHFFHQFGQIGFDYPAGISFVHGVKDPPHGCIHVRPSSGRTF
ncbi:MAG TPA: hypothetical protein VED17_11325 [Nitrososphaerales archaeon]|nr:hypothetical protein [Nitrososphaerales archaeon]